MIAAVIPTIGASPMLPDLLDALRLGGVDIVWLYDNFTPGRSRDNVDTDRLADCTDKPGVEYRRTSQTIYGSWNRAMEEAAALGYPVLHVLNDDIRLTPLAIKRVTGTVLEREYAIVGYDHLNRAPGGPKHVHGSFRKRGVPGFAFAVDPCRCPRVHAGFRWWGGDDDLFHRAEAIGEKLAVLPGAHVEHPEPSLSSNRYPLEKPWHDHDRALLTRLWDDPW